MSDTDLSSTDFKSNLEKVLAEARNVGRAAVCVGGSADKTLPALPGLAIRRDDAADEAFRRVPLPIDDMNAEFLRSCGRASAYGKGLETHVDARVRSCTELLPAQFRFDHPRWQQAIDALVARSYDSMRGYDQRVPTDKDALVAEPYKLLLYSTGDHFLAHRDTEKSPGMFATLIVQLPSLCAGGDLLVRFGGVETAHLFGRDTGMAEYECHFAMHYADVEHELRRIESGHRLAVVYNVCWRGAVPLPPSLMSSATAFETVQPLVSALSMWPRDRVPALVLPLDHLYTHDGLSGRGVAGLKGDDRRLARLLQRAAAKFPMRLFLLSMEREEHDYGNGWDEDDIDWNDGSELERVHFCFDASGRSVPYVSRYAERLAPLSNHSFDDVDFWGVATHTEEDLNLGNEGASRTTSYECCALLLVPVADDNSLGVRLQLGGFAAAVAKFREAPSLSSLAYLCRWCARQSELEWRADDVVVLLDFASAGAHHECALELLRMSTQHVPCAVGRRFVASVARASRASGGGVDALASILRQLVGKLTSGAVADVLNEFSEPFEALRAVLEAVAAASPIAKEDGAALAKALARIAHASIVEPIGRLLLVLQGIDERRECIRALWDHADHALRPMLIDTMRAHPLADVPHAVALMQLCCALLDDEQLIDSVVVERILAPERRSTLLMPVIEALIKLNVNNDALHRLCRARIDDLERLLTPGAPALSWALPVDFYNFDRGDIQAFVRDAKRSQVVLSNFRGIVEARSAARRWSSGTVRCVASGSGKHACVSVEKTHPGNQAAVDAYQRNVAEKQRLEQWVQVARGGRKRARAVDDNDNDEQHDSDIPTLKSEL
jgi:hypothetical protein